MADKTGFDSKEKAFTNSFGLVKTYTAKLNREKAQKAKEKINRNRLFVNFMRFQEDTKKMNKNNNEHFYRKANKDDQAKKMSRVYSSVG